MLRYWRMVLYKEPFGGHLPWLNLGAGCFSLLVGMFIIFSERPSLLVGPFMLTLGLMLVCWGVSDLLSPERRSAVLALRAGFLVFQSAVIVLAVAALLWQGLSGS